MAKRKAQEGFGAVGVLVVCLVMITIAGSGWFVYQHNRVKSVNAASGINQEVVGTTSADTTAVSDQNIIMVSELGITIAVPDSIKDLTYLTKTVTLRSNRPATVAFFSTASLAAADTNCSSSAAPLGSLSRVDGQYPTEKEDETNVLDYGQLVRQFPTFFISAGYPQAGCSAKAAVQVSADAYKNDFKNSQVTIQIAN